MTITKYDEMSLKELRQYVLTHREDIEAFHHYIDRSKSEGQMTTLDLSDSQWEEKVKAAIRNNAQAIRWSCHRREENSSNLSKITNWWKQLDEKEIIQYHITGMEVDTATGILEPTQLSSPQKIIIREPNIKLGELTAFVNYRNQDGSTHSIEAVTIDLDLIEQNLFIWSIHSAEVFIFSVSSN
jgi:hypothetical protein